MNTALLPWEPLAKRRACSHPAPVGLTGCLPGSSGFYCFECGQQLSSVLGDICAGQQTALINGELVVERFPEVAA